MPHEILVTGASGFLGHHVVDALLAAGYRVRALNRSTDRRLEGHGVELVRGSILDGATVESAVKGCAAVIHVAGKVSRDRRDAAELRELHVVGTRRVLEAVQRAGVTRVVYVSSSGTIACSRDAQHIATEDDPYPLEVTRTWPYYATKIEAEREALTLSRQLGLELVCLNPSLLLGPGDARLSSTDDVLKLLRRQLPALPSGGTNFVDVRDVAATTAAALDRGRAGERYLLGALNCSLRQFFTRVAELGHVTAPRLPLPDTPTRWMAYALQPLFRMLKKDNPLDPVSIEMSQVYWYFDSAKARRELGFVPRHPDDTLRDTIADLRARYLAPPHQPAHGPDAGASSRAHT